MVSKVSAAEDRFQEAMQRVTAEMAEGTLTVEALRELADAYEQYLIERTGGS